MSEYFCAGVMINRDEKPKFALVQCSGKDVPYIVRDKNNGALRLTGNTASLYMIDLERKILVKVNDKHYGLDEYPMPNRVNMDADMISSITKAITTNDFLDLYT